MKRGFLLAGLCLSLSIHATEPDSLKVDKLLAHAQTLPADSSRTLHFAKQLLGTPYVAGTLEVNDHEALVVNVDEVDCTTFVETILALCVADKKGEPHYNAFKQALKQIRYRDGVLDGYASRLHYFSDWIADNERMGFVEEYTSELDADKQTLQLDFMSTHPESYRQLKEDSSLVRQLQAVESHWQGVEVSYLPKHKLNLPPQALPIKNGDILAITTRIKGLDVVHVGFAFWKGEKLHLLHASSNAMKVIADPQPLYDYSKNKKAHTGVRAIRVIR